MPVTENNINTGSAVIANISEGTEYCMSLTRQRVLNQASKSASKHANTQATNQMLTTKKLLQLVITVPSGHLTDTSAPSEGPDVEDVWSVQAKLFPVGDDVMFPNDFRSRRLAQSSP